MRIRGLRILLWCASATLVLFATPSLAAGNVPESIIVFGASLEDPGNAFALTGEQSTPPYTENLNFLLVPNPAYARGGHHLSNGATWVEQLAGHWKLNRWAGPAFRNPGQFYNYAVAQSRAQNDGVNLNFREQLGAFYAQPDALALLPRSLVMITVGGNDVRDALQPGVGVDPIVQAVNAIEAGVRELYAHGAREFLLANAPDIGLIPSVLILDRLMPSTADSATALADLFDQLLRLRVEKLRALPGIDIAFFDGLNFLRDVVNNPADYG